MYTFLLGSAILFMVQASENLWIPVICIETLLAGNPFFATVFIWEKYVYSYNYWMNSSDEWRNVHWFLWNKALPEIIGLGFCIIWCGSIFLRQTSVGLGSVARTGNDGNFRKMKSAPK